MFTLRHTQTILLSLLLTGSFISAYASAPMQLPCAVWSEKQSLICMRTPTPILSASIKSSLSNISNLAVDQAMGSLKQDILIVSKPENQTNLMQVSLRKSPPVAMTTKVKNTATKAQYTPATIIKPQLSRSQIVQQELKREKAALRAAENQLNQAKKTGKNVNKWQRQVTDRRASISAMQAELARL